MNNEVHAHFTTSYTLNKSTKTEIIIINLDTAMMKTKFTMFTL